MTSEDIAFAVAKGLDEIDVPYMLSGSLATNLYAIPRSTQDAGFVVELAGDDVGRIAEHLSSSFRFDEQMSFETVTGTFRYEAWHEATEFHIEFYLLSDDDHDQERFARRLQVDIGGQEIAVPTAEDVVVSKLRWLLHASRAKDREDLINLLTVSGSDLDWSYVEQWTDRHGTRDLLDEIRDNLPDV